MFQRTTAVALSRLPVRLLERLETASQLAQGKGWGAASTRQEVDACASLLGDGARSRPLTVVDVGANEGLWSTEVSGRLSCGALIAFEPEPEAFAQLSRALQGRSNAQALNLAVGERDGWARVERPASGSSHSTALLVEPEDYECPGLVRMVTLDRAAVVEPLAVIDILKIDTEGGEWAVLQGGESVLQRTRVLQFEFGERTLDRGQRFRDFWRLLHEHGFQLWRQTPSGLVRIERYEMRLETFMCTNYFGVRR
jgi:FkbM family methyltransferase